MFTGEQLLTRELFTFDELDNANALTVTHGPHHHAEGGAGLPFAVAG